MYFFFPFLPITLFPTSPPLPLLLSHLFLFLSFPEEMKLKPSIFGVKWWLPGEKKSPVINVKSVLFIAVKFTASWS